MLSPRRVFPRRSRPQATKPEHSTQTRSNIVAGHAATYEVGNHRAAVITCGHRSTCTEAWPRLRFLAQTVSECRASGGKCDIMTHQAHVFSKQTTYWRSLRLVIGGITGEADARSWMAQTSRMIGPHKDRGRMPQSRGYNGAARRAFACERQPRSHTWGIGIAHARAFCQRFEATS
jgi:hypothetical protein